MKKRIVLLGPPAAGKGTQADLLLQKLQIPSFSPGSVLREEKRAGTPVGVEADKLTRCGQLISDEIVLGLVANWIEVNSNAFVLDGIPRTQRQADLLEKLLEQRNQPVQIAIQLDASDESIRRRVSSRRICGECNKIYGLGFNVPGQQRECPKCGSILQVRSDDDLSVLDSRLREYSKKTSPLIGYYQQKGILARVDANSGADQIFAEVVKVLEQA